MAWVEVPEDTASRELEELTEPWRSRGEQVPPVIGVLKGRPRAFRSVLELNYTVTFGASSLGRQTEELIAVWVSALNDCFFCLATHGRYLEQVWSGSREGLTALFAALGAIAGSRQERDPESLVAQVVRQISLGQKELELLGFVAALSLAPKHSTREGFEKLRREGYADHELVDIVLVTGNFALMNRLACGTGVVLDRSKHEAAERMFGRAALERHLSWGSAG